MENISFTRISTAAEIQNALLGAGRASRSTAETALEPSARSGDLRSPDAVTISRDEPGLYTRHGFMDGSSPGKSPGVGGESGDEGRPKGPGEELTEEEREVVDELQSIDREIRGHEQAHMSAGGGLAGSASYTTTLGPDGKSYAVGGGVPIDTSKGSSPEETIAKARRIRAAALAPAQPSSQDYAVASRASQMEAEARREQIEERTEEKTGETSGQGGMAPGLTGLVREEAMAPEDERAANPARAFLWRAVDAYRQAFGERLPALPGSAVSLAV